VPFIIAQFAGAMVAMMLARWWAPAPRGA
jgi:hypothetical protein